MTSPPALTIQLDADGASRIEGNDWTLRACARSGAPDSIELLVAALGACAAQTCAPIIARAKLPTDSFHLRTSAIRDGLMLKGLIVELQGADDLAAKLERAIRACPVARALDPSTPITIRNAP
jgi:uncharacterized OsmC-like protein